MIGEEKDDTKRPDGSPFKQQKLKAWQPLLTPPWVIGTFFFVGSLFMIIGGVVYAASQQVVEYEMRYDNSVDCQINNNTNCSMTFLIQDKMTAPIFFLLQIDEFLSKPSSICKVSR